MNAKQGMALVAAGMIGLLLLLLLMTQGCLKPPDGMMYFDSDGDGKTDSLAYDRNSDGEADLDDEGKPEIVPGSSGYRTAQRVDAIGPGAIAWIGSLFGMPALVGIGWAWRRAKWGRIFMNTVMSVQQARQVLQQVHSPDAAAQLVDEALRNKQTAETYAAIKKIKDAKGLHLKAPTPV